MKIKGLGSDCEVGIKKSSYKSSAYIIEKAYTSGTFQDNYYSGSFCPPTSGLYRLLYEGPTNDNNEAAFSSYTFNEITTKNRTTAYHYLYSHTCYSYIIKHSYPMSTFEASLYYQKDSGNKEYITNDTSYTCQRAICLKGSTDPRCFQYATCKSRQRNTSVITLILIHLMIAR